MKKTYGIKHKTTGLFFGGFDTAQNPLWVQEVFAKGMDMMLARAQATLLAIHGNEVQRKPVMVAA